MYLDRHDSEGNPVDLRPDSERASARRRALQRALAQDAPEFFEFEGWTYAIVSERAVLGNEPPEDIETLLEEPHIMLRAYAGDKVDLRIPEEIEGLPVRELGSNAFADSKLIEHVIMPDSIVYMGAKVFAYCTRLRSVHLSDSLTELDEATFRNCRNLSELHLPASLKSLSYRLIASCRLPVLNLPVSLERIDWENAEYEATKRIVLDRGNETFTSDGLGLYSADGETLLRMLAPVVDYSVLPGCKHIAKDAFKSMLCLRHVDLGNDVEDIGPYAFFRTSIRTLELPETLRSIGERAFYQCARLSHLEFTGPVEEVNPYAFSKTNLDSLRLPASVRRLGTGAVAGARLVGQHHALLEIDTDNPYLYTDGQALYARHDDGLHLTSVLVIDGSYTPIEGTVAIEDEALAHSAGLTELHLPEGLTRIGSKACYSCTNLTVVDLPSTLFSIGAQAFTNTCLSEVRLGPSVAQIGEEAFACVDSAPGSDMRPMLNVELDADNQRYYLEENLLIERNTTGDTVLFYYGDAESVTIPAPVTEIGPRAFYHAPIRDLTVHADIRHVARTAFSGVPQLEHVYVEMTKQELGMDGLDVWFPGDLLGVEGVARSLVMNSSTQFFRPAEYDTWLMTYWILNASSVVAVAKMMLARIEQPYQLTEKVRKDFDSCMNSILIPLCLEYARARDFPSFERLFEHGYVNEDNIDRILREIEDAGEAEATAYLLDVKRARYGIGGHDFSL